MPRNDTNAIGANSGSSAAWSNIAKDRDDKERLLGGVEEVQKKVSVYMPFVQLPRADLALPLFPETDDEAVMPHLRRVGYAIFATEELADCAPRFGRKFGDEDRGVRGHIRPFGVPG